MNFVSNSTQSLPLLLKAVSDTSIMNEQQRAVIRKYDALMNSERENKKRRFRNDSPFRHKWTAEDLER